MNEPRPMRISDIARMVGRSPSSLRDLERKGVIPEAIRDRSGQRRYAQRDVGVISAALLNSEPAPQRHS